MTDINTSSNRQPSQSSDWIRFDEGESGGDLAINLNLVEEAHFYPDGDNDANASLTIYYPSGRKRQIKGKKASLLWNLVEQSLSSSTKHRTVHAPMG